MLTALSENDARTIRYLCKCQKIKTGSWAKFRTETMKILEEYVEKKLGALG
jgi:hypothetical protein